MRITSPMLTAEDRAQLEELNLRVQVLSHDAPKSRPRPTAPSADPIRTAGRDEAMAARDRHEARRYFQCPRDRQGLYGCDARTSHSTPATCRAYPRSNSRATAAGWLTEAECEQAVAGLGRHQGPPVITDHCTGEQVELGW